MQNQQAAQLPTYQPTSTFQQLQQQQKQQIQQLQHHQQQQQQQLHQQQLHQQQQLLNSQLQASYMPSPYYQNQPTYAMVASAPTSQYMASSPASVVPALNPCGTNLQGSTLPGFSETSAFSAAAGNLAIILLSVYSPFSR